MIGNGWNPKGWEWEKLNEQIHMSMSKWNKMQACTKMTEFWTNTEDDMAHTDTLTKNTSKIVADSEENTPKKWKKKPLDII